MRAIVIAFGLVLAATPARADGLCHFGSNIVHRLLSSRHHIRKPIAPPAGRMGLRIEGRFAPDTGANEDRTFSLKTGGDALLNFYVVYSLAAGHPAQDVKMAVRTDKDLMEHWTTPYHPAAGDTVRVDALFHPDSVTYRVYTSPEGFAGPFMQFDQLIGASPQVWAYADDGFKLTSARFAETCPASQPPAS